eukprot:1419343-Pleurochrysis_carterae.AAC.1
MHCGGGVGQEGTRGGVSKGERNSKPSCGSTQRPGVLRKECRPRVTHLRCRCLTIFRNPTVEERCAVETEPAPLPRSRSPWPRTKAVSEEALALSRKDSRFAQLAQLSREPRAAHEQPRTLHKAVLDLGVFLHHQVLHEAEVEVLEKALIGNAPLANVADQAVTIECPRRLTQQAGACFQQQIAHVAMVVATSSNKRIPARRLARRRPGVHTCKPYEEHAQMCCFETCRRYANKRKFKQTSTTDVGS